MACMPISPPYNIATYFRCQWGSCLTHLAYDLALVSELFLREAQEELRSCGLQALCCGGENRTHDLELMKLTSYLCSTPRFFIAKNFFHHTSVVCKLLYMGLFVYYKNITKKLIIVFLIY
jgi:hypothetical protein